ncbi:MAG: ABC transporter ATP-binding protein [Clostridia bacterium]|nr:ABC transporter ATP-binding protein [Clostridia bacterium]
MKQFFVKINVFRKAKFIVMSLMELKMVSKKYRTGTEDLFALDNINLNIDKGEFVSIIGKSGSGKSTLMNILGFLDIPTSGKYLFEDNDINKMKESSISQIRSRKIGFIFQSFNLIPTLSALENVELPLVYQKVNKNKRREKATSALESVGLSHRTLHRPNQLSGGQQQRVAIARALALNPEVILADEPTGNLDSSSGNEVMNLLKKFNQNGKTVIIITHDDSIAHQAGRIITISDGKII